ncbi:Cytochrome P450 71B36 [Linum grandiflorum]
MAALFLFLLLLIPFLLLIIIKTKTQNRNLPPSPPKLPILGNLHQLGSLPHQSLWQLSRKYGPDIFQFHFGRIRSVIISSPEAAKQVMKVNDLATCSRPSFDGSRRLTYDYLDVGFSPYAENWRFMRKMIILELFSLKRVKSFRFVREEEVGFLIDSLRNRSGSVVNLTEKLFALTANVTFRMSFGFNYHGTEFDQDRSVINYILLFIKMDSVMVSVLKIVDKWSGHHARIERVFGELDGFFSHVIDEHLKHGSHEKADDEKDMIDVLLGVEDEESRLGQSSRFKRDNIKAVLLNLFLGGVDTAALTLDWAMARLLANPTSMKKAQDEVRNIIGDRGRVTEDDLEKLEYMKMIVKETLRLHPPAPLLIPRESMSDVKICGYDVPAKTVIYVNAWGIGRDPNYWKDAEKFIPERFAEGTSSPDYRGQSFEYLPFGSGRRVCPGIHMGTITVEIALANLLYCFDWKLPEGMKPEDVTMEERSGVSLTASRKEPLLLVPVHWAK